MVHFTQGLPCFPEVAGREYESEWNDESYNAVSTVPWETIMGQSVHAKAVRDQITKL